MSSSLTPLRAHCTRIATALALLALLPACSLLGGNSSKAPQAAALPANPAQLGVKPLWRVNLGKPAGSLALQTAGNTVWFSAQDGSATVLDPASGKAVGGVQFKQPLATAVGTDGSRFAAISRDSTLLVHEAGKESWRVRLPASSYTAPLVAGERVFVLLADRSISAFDGAGGARLWTIPASDAQDALVLSKPGVLLAVGDTLVAGVGGRLQGINPTSGQLRWDVAIANSRSTNEVERLVDIVGPAYRLDKHVCVRAYQSAVGCVNAETESLSWTQTARGAEGVGGDRVQVVGTEMDGKVQAWMGSNGARSWTQTQLQFRKLSAPVITPSAVVFGDEQGTLYFLDKQDGKLLEYLTTDGSAIVAAPVLLADKLLVATSAGNVFAYAAP